MTTENSATENSATDSTGAGTAGADNTGAGGATVADKIVKAAKDFGLPPQSEEVIRSADKLITEAVHKATDYVAEHRETIDGYVEKVGAFVDDKTDGKYHDKVRKAQDAADDALSRFTSTPDPTSTPDVSASPDEAAGFHPPTSVGEEPNA